MCQISINATKIVDWLNENTTNIDWWWQQSFSYSLRYVTIHGRVSSPDRYIHVNYTVDVYDVSTLSDVKRIGTAIKTNKLKDIDSL